MLADLIDRVSLESPELSGGKETLSVRHQVMMRNSLL